MASGGVQVDGKVMVETNEEGPVVSYSYVSKENKAKRLGGRARNIRSEYRNDVIAAATPKIQVTRKEQ